MKICLFKCSVVNLYFRELRQRPDEDNETKHKVTVVKSVEPPQRCKECRQMLDDPDLNFFAGDPEDAVSNILFALHLDSRSDTFEHQYVMPP